MPQHRKWKLSGRGHGTSAYLAPRRVFAALALAGTLSLQGCASSTQTFVLGALLGSVAGVTAVTCTVLCH